MTEDDDDGLSLTSLYELLDAVEAVIKAADPAKREHLAKTIDAYSEDFAEDFFWAIGAQAPTLLSNLMIAIDAACRPEAQSKPRGAPARSAFPRERVRCVLGMLSSLEVKVLRST